LRPVNPADIGENILAPFFLQAQLTDFGTDGSLNISMGILH
jgi:hypothetical protein